MRQLFTDGFNSFAHVTLGFAFGPSFIVPFLIYQFVLKPDVNSGVDSLEYISGWIARAAGEK